MSDLPGLAETTQDSQQRNNFPTHKDEIDALRDFVADSTPDTQPQS
jgi:hypothetical protein